MGKIVITFRAFRDRRPEKSPARNDNSGPETFRVEQNKNNASQSRHNGITTVRPSVIGASFLASLRSRFHLGKLAVEKGAKII